MHCHGNCHSLPMFEMFTCHLEMQAQRITPKLAMWVSVNPSMSSLFNRDCRFTDLFQSKFLCYICLLSLILS